MRHDFLRKGAVFALIVGIIFGMPQSGHSDSTKGFKIKAGIWSATSAIFAAATAYDTVQCAIPVEGEVAPGGLLLASACAEAAIAGIMTAQAIGQVLENLNKAKEQKGQKEVGSGGDVGGEQNEECPEENKRACEILERANVPFDRPDDCTCVPRKEDLPVTEEGVITDPVLAEQVPDRFKEDLKKFANDPSSVSGLGEEFGQFAGVDQDSLKNALDQKLGSDSGLLGGVGGPLGGEDENRGEFFDDEEEGEDGEEIGFSAKGTTASRPTARLPTSVAQDNSGKSRLEEISEKAAQRRRLALKKAARKKGSGIIADELKGIFAAVAKRYDKMESDEFHKKHYVVAKGKLKKVKFIPGKTAVKEALGTVRKSAKDQDLSRQIQKYGK